MESLPQLRCVSFAVLRARLVEHVTRRVQNGEFSERGLARFLGISQPQLHNVLKGARRLQPELADRILESFELSLTALLTAEEIVEEAAGRQLELFAAAAAWTTPPQKPSRPSAKCKKPVAAADDPRREWLAS